MAELICTIGYEGVAISDVVEALHDAGVSLLIDVRAVPLSRKKGFSKTALSLALENEGISYLHLRDLGNPKPGRDAAKMGHYDVFEQVFLAHLKTDTAQAAVVEAVELSYDRTVCLLCFEADPATCHRSFVAQAMVAKRKATLKHLRPVQRRTNRNGATSSTATLAFG